MVNLKDWQEINIGNDTTLKARIGWQGLTTSEYKDSGEYYLVTGTDFENGLVNWDTCHFVDKWRFDQDKNIQLKVNDVLITKDGTIGKAGFIDTIKLPTTLNSGVFVIRANSNKLDQKYLYYIFTSKIFVEFLNRLTAGSTINHLYQKDFVHFTFKAPKLEEQKAIAKALSDTDELINSLEKLISKKEAIKQGTMQQLLSGKKRLSGFSEKWEEKLLEEVANISRGASPRPIEDPKWFDNNSDIGWVRISDISKTTKFLNKTVQKLSQDGISKSRFVKKDNLIMSICATLGKPILTKLDTCIHDGFVVFNNLQIDKEFLYYFLFFIEKDWLKSGQTGSQMNLNTELINSTIILLPPTIKEQQAIAQILSDMDNEIESLKSKLSKTKAIKNGMMEKLLTGEIRLVKKDIKITKHNKHFEDAVIIAVLANIFANDKFPIGRKRYTKLSYLLHRKQNHTTEEYLKKAAGPYNPKTKYGGAEKIALNKNYVKEAKNGQFSGFISDKNIAEAKEYFLKWFGNDMLDWIEQFRYDTNDKLELLATVDMSIQNLIETKQEITLENIKTIIKSDVEWKDKLKREIFSDSNIQESIKTINEIFRIIK